MLISLVSLAGVFASFGTVFSFGIPGIGVLPFGIEILPGLEESGIPGVVPVVGLFAFIEFGSGIPGVEFPVAGTRLFENLGGKFIGLLALILVFVELRF